MIEYIPVSIFIFNLLPWISSSQHVHNDEENESTTSKSAQNFNKISSCDNILLLLQVILPHRVIVTILLSLYPCPMIADTAASLARASNMYHTNIQRFWFHF
jgi:hypothetical protein